MACRLFKWGPFLIIIIITRSSTPKKGRHKREVQKAGTKVRGRRGNAKQPRDPNAEVSTAWCVVLALHTKNASSIRSFTSVIRSFDSVILSVIYLFSHSGHSGHSGHSAPAFTSNFALQNIQSIIVTLPSHIPNKHKHKPQTTNTTFNSLLIT